MEADAAYSQLKAACERRGLITARRQRPPCLVVAMPAAPDELYEAVLLSPDGSHFLYSWGELLGPVTAPDDVADRLRRVVSVTG